MAPCQRPRLLLPMLLLLQNITNVVRTTAVTPSPAALPSFVADPPHASPGAGTKPFAGFTTARAWGSADARLATLEFLYVAVADVVKGPRPGADDDWESVFEPALRAAAAKSRHIIVRFYLDYPNKPSGVPEYLRNGGLRMDSYTEYGGGQSPDYFNNTLIQAVVDFVGRMAHVPAHGLVPTPGNTESHL